MWTGSTNMGVIMNRVRFDLAGFFKRFSEPPEDFLVSQYRYFVVYSYVFFAALLFHFFFIFIFLLISVKPLAFLNIGSTAIWIVILWLHFKGKRITSISLACFEVILHAVMCVVSIGWGTGFQYYVLTLPLMVFFSPWGNNRLRVSLSVVFSLLYVALYFFFGNATPPYTIEPWLRLTLYCGNSLALCFVLSLAAYYYSTAATNAELTLEKEKAKLEELTVLLRKMFGRYLSTEVMNSLIDNPSTLELGGQKRSVTIMMSDLRGFTAVSERLEPEQVVQLLNTYFDVMVEVILRYNGTINEIIGDAMLIIFGAPQEMSDRAQQAIACAIEMQNRMAEVNERNRSQGLPDLEMGIGLNETEVVVGNIGSVKRSKYGAVGSGVNMTNRIESYTVGGQIFISESVRQKAGDVLRIDAQRDVLPKGAETSVRIYEVGGIAGGFNLVLQKKEPRMVSLAQQVPILYTVLDGKDVSKKALLGFAVEISKNGANIALSGPVEVLANLKMNLADVDENLSARDFYGKVTKSSGEKRHLHEVHFTSVPPEVDSYFQALQKYASKQAAI
jgi:class 3 adenylate cyclase